MLVLIPLLLSGLLYIQPICGRLHPNRSGYVSSSAQKHESILYSCFINNGETETIIHNPQPIYLNTEHRQSLHEGISLSISTFACYHYNHINFTFSLQLFQNLYAKDGGFKIYKDGQIQRKPSFKQKFRAFLGDVIIFEYKDDKSSPNIKQGQASLAFLGDISIFNQENIDEHKDLYKCQSFSATIWTQDVLYEIRPIPTSKSSSKVSPPICNTMTLSAIPINKLDSFSRNVLNPLILNQNENENQDLNETNPEITKRRLVTNYDYIINKLPCSWWGDAQWTHHNAIKIGLVIDRGFYSKFGFDDDMLDEYISLMFINSNGVYQPQLNVQLIIGTVFVTDDVPNVSNLPNTNWWWLDGKSSPTACKLSYDQVTNIRQWQWDLWHKEIATCSSKGFSIDKNNLGSCPDIDKHATWALLSDCWEGFGIAPVGALCEIDWLNGCAVNYDKEQTWMSFAHEIGHVVGAGHFFDNGNGGIMDYGAQLFEGISQFRTSDGLCSGLQDSRIIRPSNKPGCWSVFDYKSTKYEWYQTGIYGACYPLCGKFRYHSENIECRQYTQNAPISTVADINCGIDIKPLPEFAPCDVAVCPASICGNGLWELTEQCDITLDADNCCSTTCQRVVSDVCKRKKRQINAAFTDSNGKLYLFQDNQFAIYSNPGITTIGVPDKGYPKLISTSFPISTWISDFDAAFATSDDIAYFFKGLSYIRVDLTAFWINTNNAQIDSVAIKIKPKNDAFELGYIPDAFWSCARIDAAFISSYDEVTFVCDSISYTWNIRKNGGYDNVYRPILDDYDLKFSGVYTKYTKIDAASYNWKQKRIRFYAADMYTDYANGKRIGGELKLPPMGYYIDNANIVINAVCKTGEVRFNGDCYNSSYLVVMEFENTAFDSAYILSSTGLTYGTNGGVFAGTNAAVFALNTKINLKIPKSQYTVISNYKITVWLYPTTSNNDQDFIHIVDKDGSQIVYVLNKNTKCSDTTNQITILVKHITRSGVQHTVFEDTHCQIPLTINKWSKVTFDSIPYMIAVTVNSKVSSKQIMEGNQIDLSVALSSWYLGVKYIGKMDWFVFKETDGVIVYLPPTPKPTAAACLFPGVDNVGEMIAYLITGLVLYSTVMWALYKYYGARILVNEIAARLNMEQRQQQQQQQQPPQIPAEVAAGAAIQAIEQVLSGHVTPDASPRFEKRPSDNKQEIFLSPKNIRFTLKHEDGENVVAESNIDGYDGNQLVSPAKRSNLDFAGSNEQ